MKYLITILVLLITVFMSCKKGSEPQVEKFSIETDSLILSAGDSVLVEDFLIGAIDKSLYAWRSEDTNVVSISSTLFAKAKSPGRVTLTVRQNQTGIEDFIVVKVIPVPLKSITFENTVLLINQGYTGKITPVIAPANVTDKSLKWKSSNERVVTVDSNGTISAKWIGEADIFVSNADETVNGQIKVRVAKNKCLVKNITTGGNITSYEYDVFGRNTLYQYSIDNIKGLADDYVFNIDSAGRINKWKIASFRWVDYEYDTSGFLVKATFHNHQSDNDYIIYKDLYYSDENLIQIVSKRYFKGSFSYQTETKFSISNIAINHMYEGYDIYQEFIPLPSGLGNYFGRALTNYLVNQSSDNNFIVNYTYTLGQKGEVKSITESTKGVKTMFEYVCP